MAVSNHPMTPGRILLSYRRDEAAFPASWLYERLAAHFGADQIFQDVEATELGDDFAEVIADAVGACDVLLVLIGDEWLTITDEAGRRRLERPDDLVRLEIEAALERKVRIIPILVGRAGMPDADQLPASLAKLVRRQALELNPSRFETDARRVVRVVEMALAEEEARRGAEARRSGEENRVSTVPTEAASRTAQAEAQLQRQEPLEEAQRPVLPSARFVGRVPAVEASRTGARTVPIEIPAPPPEDNAARVRPARRLALVAGVGLAGLLVAGGIAYAQYDRDGGEGGAVGLPSPAVSTGPTATPSPTTPADELCTDEIKSNPRWVCLTSAVLANGRLTIRYEVDYNKSVPDIHNGYHVHLYGSDGRNPPDSMMGTQAPKSQQSTYRYYWVDREPAVLHTDDGLYTRAIGNFPKVCARIAIASHGLVPDNKGGYRTGNCVPITRS